MKRNSRNHIDAAITYGWNRVSYNVLRSLAGRGLKVAVGDVSGTAMSKRSKFCTSSFSYPSFHRDPEGFVKSLKEYFRIIKPRVYIPIHEEIFVVAKYMNEFSGLDVEIPIHDFQTLRSVHKKDSLNEIVRELGLPAPHTLKPRDYSDLRSVWDEVGGQGKAVIKLIHTNSAKGIYYVESLEALQRKFEALVEKQHLRVEEYPIVQEYVSGDGYGVSMLYNRGNPRARFTHKRLREKISTGGTSTKRVSVRNPIIEEIAEHILSSLNWHGVAMVEFKYNERTKKGWLIEINPRFWGSLALPIEAGVDFPYLLYRMATDGDVETAFNYREGVVVRWLLGDVLATLSDIKARRSLKPIVDFFSFKGEKYDDLRLDDPVPFVFQCLYYLGKSARTFSLNPTDEAVLNVDRI